jgi:hypothetical protein
MPATKVQIPQEQESDQGTLQGAEPVKKSTLSVVLRELLIVTRAAIGILAVLSAFFVGKDATHTTFTIFFMVVFVLLAISYLYSTYGKPAVPKYIRAFSLFIMGGLWIAFGIHARNEMNKYIGYHCLPDPCEFEFSGVNSAVPKISIAGGVVVLIEVIASLIHGPIYNERKYPNIHPLDPTPVPVIGGF